MKTKFYIAFYIIVIGAIVNNISFVLRQDSIVLNPYECFNLFSILVLWVGIGLFNNFSGK